MAFFSNPAINLLAVHSTVHQFAWALSGAFFATFLFRSGLEPAVILLAAAAALALRFATRPLVLLSVSAFGLRNTLVLGGLLFAAQRFAVAAVHGPDLALLLYVVVSALGDVFYWTCYHTFFAAHGDREKRGAQLGARGLLQMLAGSAGPGVGGLLLSGFGPWTAFGTGAAIELAAIIPLLLIAEPPIAVDAPRGAFRASRDGVILMATDGFIACASIFTWDLISFLAYGQRFDVLGAVLAAASLVGAVAGMAFGRFIDAGHAARVVGLNAAVLAGLIILKALCAGSPVAVVAATLTANAVGGLYIPALMTAVYNEAKSAPCVLRFHFAAEGGWDAGGILACLLGAAAWHAGVPPPIILLMTLMGVAAQAIFLHRRYAAQETAVA